MKLMSDTGHERMDISYNRANLNTPSELMACDDVKELYQ
jgi:hypothetical protein